MTNTGAPRTPEPPSVDTELPAAPHFALAEPAVPEQGLGLRAAVAQFERACIERALLAAGGNRVQAARALKISRRWLFKKLQRYGAGPAD